MSQGIHKPLIARPLALVAALIVAFATLMATASPAHAHDELLGSSPAADSTVDALPAELALTFSGVIAPDAGASEVQVTDASGTSLTGGAPTAQDNVLTQPLAGEASGAVTVLWKVVSSDGHPISGEFSFTVAAAPTPTETAPAPSATPTEPAGQTAEPTPIAEPSTPPVDEASSFGDVWPWVVFGIIAIGAGGAVVYLLVSRARREKALNGAGPTPSGDGSEPPAER